jgi:hypothetical protein
VDVKDPVKNIYIITYNTIDDKNPYFSQRVYTDEDMKWDTPLPGAFHSIHLSVSVALEYA